MIQQPKTGVLIVPDPPTLTTDEQLTSDLQRACRSATTRVAEFERLLWLGADVKQPAAQGVTALMIAAEVGRPEVLKILLEAGAKVDRRTEGGWTSLHYAAYRGKTRAIQCLVKHCKDTYGEKYVDAFVRYKDKTQQQAVHKAAALGHDDAVARLLDEFNAELTCVDENNYGLIHLAAAGGHHRVVRVLLDRGADVGARTKSGWTALHLAAHGSHAGTVGTLVQHTDNPPPPPDQKGGGGGKNRRGSKAGAAVKLPPVTTTKMLMLARDRSGETALHKAAFNCDNFITETLLEKGSDVNAKNKANETPLHLAIRSSCAIKPFSLEDKRHNADLWHRSWTAGLSTVSALPPCMFTSFDAKSTVRTLLKGGADVAATDKEGLTPGTLARQLLRRAQKDHKELLGTRRARDKSVALAVAQAAIVGEQEKRQLVLARGLGLGKNSSMLKLKRGLKNKKKSDAAAAKRKAKMMKGLGKSKLSALLGGGGGDGETDSTSDDEEEKQRLAAIAKAEAEAEAKAQAEADARAEAARIAAQGVADPWVRDRALRRAAQDRKLRREKQRKKEIKRRRKLQAKLKAERKARRAAGLPSPRDEDSDAAAAAAEKESKRAFEEARARKVFRLLGGGAEFLARRKVWHALLYSRRARKKMLALPEAERLRWLLKPRTWKAGFGMLDRRHRGRVSIEDFLKFCKIEPDAAAAVAAARRAKMLAEGKDPSAAAAEATDSEGLLGEGKADERTIANATSVVAALLAKAPAQSRLSSRDLLDRLGETIANVDTTLKEGMTELKKHVIETEGYDGLRGYLGENDERLDDTPPWEECVGYDEEGNPYYFYFNWITEESVWERPVEMDEYEYLYGTYWDEQDAAGVGTEAGAAEGEGEGDGEGDGDGDGDGDGAAADGRSHSRGVVRVAHPLDGSTLENMNTEEDADFELLGMRLADFVPRSRPRTRGTPGGEAIGHTALSPPGSPLHSPSDVSRTFAIRRRSGLCSPPTGHGWLVGEATKHFEENRIEAIAPWLQPDSALEVAGVLKLNERLGRERNYAALGHDLGKEQGKLHYGGPPRPLSREYRGVRNLPSREERMFGLDAGSVPDYGRVKVNTRVPDGTF